jgi:DNA-binding NtrC family response regulator
MYRVLVADDDKATVSCLHVVLKEWGYSVSAAANGEEAYRLFSAEPFDLVIADIRMAPVDGVALLRKIHERSHDFPVIMISGFQDITAAAEAMKAGAFDYIEKPFDIHDLATTMNRALAYRQALQGVLDLKLIVGSCHRYGDIVAESRSMRSVCDDIRKWAISDISVLVAGEKGTGRTLTVRTLHETSQRKDQPFVTVDGAAGQTGRTRSDWRNVLDGAESGSVFLREAHLLSSHDQAALMREIFRRREEAENNGQQKKLPRILASTNPDTAKTPAVLDPDLSSELSAATITIEPLRQRPADILPLFHHLLSRQHENANEVPHVDIDVCLLLGNYAWPGNVAELEEMVQGVGPVGQPPVIRLDNLPKAIRDKLGDVSAIQKPDLKNEFLLGQGLKRFLRDKGKAEMERLVDSVRSSAESAPAHPHLAGHKKPN